MSARGERHGVGLRPATTEDASLLVELRATAPEFALLPLPPEQKRALVAQQVAMRESQYRARFPDADFCIVELDGQPAGLLYASRGSDELVLVDILVAPQCRGHGIATRLVQALVTEAAARRVPLRAHVLATSPALRLWQRLGFREVGRDEVYVALEVPAPR